MNRFVLGLRTWWRVMGDSHFADQVNQLHAGAAVAATLKDQRKAGPKRSEALTLLETLQREGRFLDFVMEPLEGYSDAQIGAAARDIHRECAKTIHRLFDPDPLLKEKESSEVEVPVDFGPARYRLTGNVSGQAPYRGILRHQGWIVSKCEVPVWNGDSAASGVLAPAEIEIV